MGWRGWWAVAHRSALPSWLLHPDPPKGRPSCAVLPAPGPLTGLHLAWGASAAQLQWAGPQGAGPCTQQCHLELCSHPACQQQRLHLHWQAPIWLCPCSVGSRCVSVYGRWQGMPVQAEEWAGGPGPRPLGPQGRRRGCRPTVSQTCRLMGRWQHAPIPTSSFSLLSSPSLHPRWLKSGLEPWDTLVTISQPTGRTLFYWSILALHYPQGLKSYLDTT